MDFPTYLRLLCRRAVLGDSRQRIARMAAIFDGVRPGTLTLGPFAFPRQSKIACWQAFALRCGQMGRSSGLQAVGIGYGFEVEVVALAFA